jgi:aldehyde dehydrogenase (NAD+)
MANRTEYGLSAEIYTQNLELGREIVKKLEAGSVSINSNDYLTPTCPFGGYKKSGLGREGGKYGFHELTQTKYVFENRC